MSRFLKLSKCVINTQLIRYVLIEPAKYEIKFIAGKFEGFWILGSGQIESYDSYVTVCEKEDPEDFKYVSNWIKEQ
jgi:hypothetical protein